MENNDFDCVFICPVQQSPLPSYSVHLGVAASFAGIILGTLAAFVIANWIQVITRTEISWMSPADRAAIKGECDQKIALWSRVLDRSIEFRRVVQCDGSISFFERLGSDQPEVVDAIYSFGDFEAIQDEAIAALAEAKQLRDKGDFFGALSTLKNEAYLLAKLPVVQEKALKICTPILLDDRHGPRN